MKFDQLVQKLLEGVSPLRTMYHISYLHNMYDIITYNSFNCKNNAVDLEDNWKSNMPKIMEKYRYYMSTARTHTSSFIRSRVNAENSSVVTMELDASKLSDKGYPIYPINYFIASQDQEGEDRVLSKKNYIPNFLNYVKSFHILMKDNKDEDDNYNNEMIELMKRTGKPCFLYKDPKAFLFLNRTKREQL